MPKIALFKPDFFSSGEITNYPSQIDRLRSNALVAKFFCLGLVIHSHTRGMGLLIRVI
jgi:hypothetical protein